MHLPKQTMKRSIVWIKRHRRKAAAIGALAAAVLILIPIATFAYFARDIASKESIMNRRDTGVTLLDRHGTPFYHLYEAKTKSTVPIGQIPKHLQQAVVATEDQDFYTHPGFSIKSIAAALYADIRQKELQYGGSTITQQLVKISLLSQRKNFLRKYQELFLAAEIDRRYSKDEILEMYLNSVYFGEGAFGVEAAAQTYFSKPASQLTLAESAQLIGLLPAPSAYSPVSGDAVKAKARQKLVLDRMLEQQYITEEQHDQALARQLVYRNNANGGLQKAHHFALMVRDELIKRYGEERVIRSGFKVTTTLDLAWQNEAETALRRQLNNLRFNDVTNGAVVVMDPKNGEIKALVGSKNWNDPKYGQVNMAITPRQPGSAFKPIVFASALENKRITAATVLKDQPTTFGGNYRPKNYDLQYRGDVLARRALANSLNVPLVQIMSRVGVPKATATAEKLGISTLKESSDYGLSLVLGTAEVKLTELTGAFAVLANQGVKNNTTMVLSVENKQKKVIFRYKPKPKKVLDTGVSFIVSSILSDNPARAEIFRNSLTISRPAAVKTGTTENYRDALTVGYTPSLVVGVWIGNNDNTPMDNVAGSLGPAPVWRTLMEKFTAGTRVEPFNAPNSVVMKLICRGDGLLAPRQGAATYNEYFLPGTAPTGVCNVAPPPPPPKAEDEKEDKEEKKEEEEQEDQKNNKTTAPTPPPPAPAPAPTPLPTPGPTPPLTRPEE